ncbi:hypothetical protein SFB6_097G5, partial [Candidatus Arthromitus sp. SFB-co]
SSNIQYLTFDDSDFNRTLGDVIKDKKFNTNGEYSCGEKVVIFQNIVSKEVDIYFKLLRKNLGKNIIFATVTDTSINMEISHLFDEFKQERDYFRGNRKNK